ncbi:RHS repeat-associated core domain-containing protein [Mycoplasmatota bacterium]|nr:RHS repeat-associated core domain-containing protein [Mycoplasmatota bacterium]
MQGDIVNIVDSYGSIKVSYIYDAWGNIIHTTDNTGSLELAKKNPYRYRGYRFDEETGWYYLQSRYYNPEIGRFINADGLIGETGDILGHNMYAYTQNNPVMMVDPSGEFAWVSYSRCCSWSSSRRSICLLYNW